MSDIKKLMEKGREQGFLQKSEILEFLPGDLDGTDLLDIILDMIIDMGIKVRVYLHQTVISMSDDDDKKPDVSENKEKVTEATKEVLDGLTPREAKILRMRFGIDANMDVSLEEVARQFEVTRERIREIEAKALRKLRKNDDDDPDDDGPEAA